MSEWVGGCVSHVWPTHTHPASTREVTKSELTTTLSQSLSELTKTHDEDSHSPKPSLTHENSPTKIHEGSSTQASIHSLTHSLSYEDLLTHSPTKPHSRRLAHADSRRLVRTDSGRVTQTDLPNSLTKSHSLTKTHEED